MALQRRKFTVEEKLKILEEAQTLGVTAVLRSYNLSYSVYVKWKQKFLHAKDINQIKDSYVATQLEIKKLQEENERLKKIIAEQVLQLEFKEEEIKKIKLTKR